MNKLESAKTEFVGGTISPPTEPMFRGEAREAALALIKQIEQCVAAASDAIAEGPSTPQLQRLYRRLDAALGVARVLERALGPRTHHLKTDPEPFKQVRAGLKLYEVRKFDRDYQVGDRLVLTEFDRETQQYSGEKFIVVVTYITPPGAYGLPEDVGVLGIKPLVP